MIEHTKEPWEATDKGHCWLIRSPHHVYGLGTTAGHEMYHREHAGNAYLMAAAPTAPHECSDPQCPGDVNRRRLAMYDGLLAACEAAYIYFEACGKAWGANDGVLVSPDGRPVVEAEGLDQLCDTACDAVALALTKTTEMCRPPGVAKPEGREVSSG